MPSLCSHVTILIPSLSLSFLFSRLATLIPGIINQLDMNFENTTEWRLLKHILNVVDVIIVNTADRYDLIAGKPLLHVLMMLNITCHPLL